MSEYVLITPARNEGAYIEKIIKSVINQSILPKIWVIVSDESTDNTDDIVEKYAKNNGFIKLLSIYGQSERNFHSKVNAFKKGYNFIVDINFDFIGNLDADISFGSDYFEKILKEFESDSKLGIAGGLVCELVNGIFHPQNISLNSVAGAVQLFRRPCYEEIGGYEPNKIGGIDAIAEIKARKFGWIVRTFPEIRVLHHRRVAVGKDNILKARFRQGMLYYLLGYHPLFQAIRCLYKMFDKPFIIGSIFVSYGFLYATICKMKKVLPPDIIFYLRSEQKKRLQNIFKCI